MLPVVIWWPRSLGMHEAKAGGHDGLSSFIGDIDGASVSKLHIPNDEISDTSSAIPPGTISNRFLLVITLDDN